jgi:DNA-directed RNA polymerase
MWENKHLILGNRFTKHDMPLALDVINTLQEIPWEIDAETYLLEKETNRNLNKKKFLRVINEYLGKKFYFAWRYDSRGRSYSSGYDLNIQSNEYGKALLSLHNKELITNLPVLYIAIANHAGQDKLTWQERIDWVTDRSMEEIANCDWEEPMLGRKALRALNDTMKGKPTGYTMSLDATSSGLQIMAAISGCKDTAKLVNCVNTWKREDVYGTVADMLNDSLDKPVPRAISKQCVMTHFYNSRATPKGLLSSVELEVFYKTITGLMPGAEGVMELVNSCWNPSADSHSWTMPDGHHVYVPVIEPQNGIYTDPELGEIPLRYYEQTSSENFRSLCPNVIHSIDGYIAREMVRRCDFQLVHIHDCFKFNPNHMDDVQTTYREIMAEIAQGDIFQDILRQITGNQTLVVNKLSNDLHTCILNSVYMLS